MDSDRWILDTIEFDRAIKVAQDFASRESGYPGHRHRRPRVLGCSHHRLLAQDRRATADHRLWHGPQQRHPARRRRRPLRGSEIPRLHDQRRRLSADHRRRPQDADRLRRQRRPLRNLAHQRAADAGFAATLRRRGPAQHLSGQLATRNAATGFLVTGQIPGGSSAQAAHTATDIPLSAYGRGASLFTGVLDNTDVFFKLGQAALGGAKYDSRGDWGDN